MTKDNPTYKDLQKDLNEVYQDFQVKKKYLLKPQAIVFRLVLAAVIIIASPVIAKSIIVGLLLLSYLAIPAFEQFYTIASSFEIKKESEESK